MCSLMIPTSSLKAEFIKTHNGVGKIWEMVLPGVENSKCASSLEKLERLLQFLDETEPWSFKGLRRQNYQRFKHWHK